MTLSFALAALSLRLAAVAWAAPPSREVPFTQDDRDRIIRLEIKLEEGHKSLQQQINDMKLQIGDLKSSTQQQIGDMKSSTQQQIGDMKLQIGDLKSSTQQQFSDLKGFMLWGFSILLAGMFTLVGFVLWDRRTAVAPVQRRQKESDEEQDNIRKALREYAQKEPRLAGILKSLNLL